MAQPNARTTTDATTKAWRTAGEQSDADAATKCLAENVKVISPLTDVFEFNGLSQTREMLIAAFEVVTDLRFFAETGDDAARALIARGRVGGQELEEAQFLRFDQQGLITELTLFARPLPATTALMAAIGPVLARRQGKPGLARAIQLASAPLALGARIGERSLVPRADPNRVRP
jgi:hypothetical protein